MGAGASSSSASATPYRFGQLAQDATNNDNASDSAVAVDVALQQRTAPITWVGTTLELPPKPFSLDNYFHVHAVVGTGMLGKVRLVQHRKSNKFYALKSLSKKAVLARKLLPQLERERNALLQLSTQRHPFIVRYFGSLQTSCHVHLLLEYAPGGELFRRLHDVGGRFTNDEAKFYAVELLAFVECCHTSGYMYRDLKPENILLDSSGHVKVVDFGFVKQLASPDDRASTCIGTTQYLAPEQLTPSLETRSYTKAVDWWAWACVVYEMVNGQTPFFRREDDSPFELYTRIVQGHVAWPSRMHRALKDLLRRMLTPDLTKRLSDVDAIKQHTWLDNVDWRDVAQCVLQPPYVPPIRSEGDHEHFDEYPDSVEETKSPESTFAREFRNF